MMLTSAINSGSGAVTLKPNNTADAIQLGVATAATNNAAATLELSNSELNTITTTGGLTVGAANNTGAITVVGALTPTTAQNGFTLLNNTGGIAINAPITYAAGNGNLTLTANGGGAAAGAITTSGSALDVSRDAGDERRHRGRHPGLADGVVACGRHHPDRNQHHQRRRIRARRPGRPERRVRSATARRRAAAST